MIGMGGWHDVEGMITWVRQVLLLQHHYATSGVVLLCEDYVSLETCSVVDYTYMCWY